jgi:hypothetical protein
LPPILRSNPQSAVSYPWERTFVGKGGDPINTLELLNAKAGIFGGLVIIGTWKQPQPTPNSEINENNAIDQALADVRVTSRRLRRGICWGE